MANENIAARLKDLELSMDRTKAEFLKKISPTSFTLPTTGWVNDTSEDSDYKYYYEISVTNLTANDVVNVNLALSSLSVAENCGLCQTTKSFSGKFRIYAKSIPSQSLSIEFYVLAGES